MKGGANAQLLRRRLRVRLRLLLAKPWLRRSRASAAAKLLDVEADVQDVAVLDLIRLPFEALQAASRCLGV